MRGILTFLVIFLSCQTNAQTLSDGDIVKRIEQLEKRVKQLEEENRQLKRLLKESGYIVASRSKTKKLKVGGRILFRFSQSDNLNSKSVYGDSGNGFVIRKARFNVNGKLNDNFGFKFQLRSDRGSKVELWDAYLKYRLTSLPISFKAGQFKIPLSMSYLKSGVKLWFPERPVAVNRVVPVWRDIGVEATFKPFDNTSLTFSIFNGEGWNSGKIYNRDKKYIYTFSFDSVPVDSELLRWRIRTGYETGHDRSSKLVYRVYGASSVRRSLFDVETRFDLKPLGMAFEGGYVYDNPKDAVDENGNEVKLGNAKGYYIQGDYAVPLLKGLHLVGRYSWVDPNSSVEDENDVDYKSLGFYYLLNGWQAAVRSAYVWADERHGEEVSNDLFVTEFQLLF